MMWGCDDSHGVVAQGGSKNEGLCFAYKSISGSLFGGSLQDGLSHSGAPSYRKIRMYLAKNTGKLGGVPIARVML